MLGVRRPLLGGGGRDGGRWREEGRGWKALPPLPTPPKLGPGTNASTLRLLRALLGPLYGRSGVTWSPPQPQRGPRGAPSPARVPSGMLSRKGAARSPKPSFPPPPLPPLYGCRESSAPEAEPSDLPVCVCRGGGGGTKGVILGSQSSLSPRAHVTDTSPRDSTLPGKPPSRGLPRGLCRPAGARSGAGTCGDSAFRKLKPQIRAPSQGKALWPPRCRAGDTDETTAFSPSVLRAALTRVFLSSLCVPEGSLSPGRWDAGLRGRG